MSGKMILWILRIWPPVSGILLFGLVLSISKQRSESILLGKYAEFRGMLRTKNRETRWYKRTEEWLIRNGAAYHYGKWIQPTIYLTVRIVFALAGFAVFWKITILHGLFAAAILFYLPGWLLVYLNNQDNIRMLPEIKLIYHALELQIRAGVYVTDALAECYGSVWEPRLRQALLDLAGDIVMKADVFEALERFQGKFDNCYIDALCITILQAMESGQAIELLSDIAEQIKDMESAVLERQKASLDRSITFYQLGVLAVVMGIVLYACVTHMFAAAVHF